MATQTRPPLPAELAELIADSVEPTWWVSLVGPGEPHLLPDPEAERSVRIPVRFLLKTDNLAVNAHEVIWEPPVGGWTSVLRGAVAWRSEFGGEPLAIAPFPALVPDDDADITMDPGALQYPATALEG